MRHKLLAALLLGAALSPLPLAAQSAAPSPRFEGRDIFALQVATDPQISPDGKSVAYVRRQGDIMTDRQKGAIWLVDTATGAQRPLVTDDSQLSLIHI